ncbi:hypothetical protein EB796_009354 [Bugula neritina]|uniref:Uncharacterized protein n=1 Tax=Bugula neritina TaxID=10212 RepID=A0A7J7K2C4_BUGNE|nr:hypothetical protein EB796_009354 [Bugula neritina]
MFSSLSPSYIPIPAFSSSSTQLLLPFVLLQTDALLLGYDASSASFRCTYLVSSTNLFLFRYQLTQFSVTPCFFSSQLYLSGKILSILKVIVCNSRRKEVPC